MKIKIYVYTFLTVFFLGASNSVSSLDIPIVNNISISSLMPLDVLSQIDGLFIGRDFPVLGELVLVQDLPVIDGRGIPVIRGVDESLRVGEGLVAVVLGNSNLAASDSLLIPELLSPLDVLADLISINELFF